MSFQSYKISHVEVCGLHNPRCDILDLVVTRNKVKRGGGSTPYLVYASLPLRSRSMSRAKHMDVKKLVFATTYSIIAFT